MEKVEILKSIKEILINNKLTVATAESCTGGLISSYLTDIDGSSSFVFQNFVTYSNDAKVKFLNVKKETIDKFGAVSEQTATEMAQGLFQFAPLTLATTGILGPSGGSEEKPVGLVYISIGYKNQIKVIKYISPMAKTNDRCKIKVDIVEYALFKFLDFIKKI